MFVCMYVWWMDACMDGWMDVCMFVRMHACMYVMYALYVCNVWLGKVR